MRERGTSDTAGTPPVTGEVRRALVARLTHAAALRGERLVCVCRFIFCALVLVRFCVLSLEVPPVAQALKVFTTLLEAAEN